MIIFIKPDSLKRFATYSEFSNPKKWWFDDNILSKEEYNLLKETYKDTNEVINEICKPLHHLGSQELWCGIRAYSPDTLDFLQQLLNVMYENNIPLPSKEPFEQYVFTKREWDYDLHGFGEMFDGTQYSKFLNNK